MKITKIETFNTQNLCIVKVTTEDGQSGWGQTAHNYTDITSRVLHRQLSGFVLGQDSDDLEGISDRCVETTYKFYGSHICRAAAGIDTALWDMRAKRAGVSVAKLLGATRKTVDIYGSSMDRKISPQFEADRMERLQQEKGFRAFKLHIASGIGKDRDMYPGRTEEVVKLVRRAIGDKTELYVDPNGAYTVAGAIEIGHFFEQWGIGYFEEPCPFWQMEMSAEVARALSIPVAGGEQDYCLAQWGRIIKEKALHIAQPDILYIGGLTRALRVAAMTQEAGMLCTPHNGTFGLLQVYSVHMQAAIANATDFLEFSIDQEILDPWTKDLFFPQFVIENGKVQIPDGPGWGVQVNPEWLAKAEFMMSELS